MKKIQAVGLAALWLLTTPAFAEPTTPATSKPTSQMTDEEKAEKRRRLQDAEVNFVDSKDAYWVNKGFNDTMFGVNSGSFNEAYSEKHQTRDEEVIKKLTKSTTQIEIVYKGKVLDQAATPLKFQGKKIEAPK